MGRAPIVHLRLYPDDCDAYGHVNQAAFLRLFERARWEALATGPGTGAFTKAGAWPAIRHASVEYHAPAFAGERLAFQVALTHLGRTSMSLHQLARREGDGGLVASAYFVAVCIDENGKPIPVPDTVREFFGIRPATPAAAPRHVMVRKALLTYETAGDGEAILFIHGFPFDRTMWRHQVAGLHGYRRVASDLRGFGLSDASPERWTLADQADDLAGLLDALKIDSATVCGLSMGGYVALELLRRHRPRVRALVLANTRAEADSADGRKQRDATIESVRTHGADVLVRSMTPKVLGPATLEKRPDVAGHVRTMIGESAPSSIITALAAMRDRADSTDLLAGISVPTLVVGGTDDAVIPGKTQHELQQRIPGAELVVIGEAGHLVPLEQPAAFNRAFQAFLRRLR